MLKALGPKPRNPKSKPYYPKNGYWYARFGKTVTSLCRWTITDLDELDRQYAIKKAHFEAHQEQVANQPAELTSLERQQLTVKQLIELYITARARHIDHPVMAKRITSGTYMGYRRTLGFVDQVIGGYLVTELNPAKFAALADAASKKYATQHYNHVIVNTRMMFTWAKNNGLVTDVPLYGTEFITSGEAVRFNEVRSRPLKFFTAGQIQTLLSKADKSMKAMIYLGINCAFSQVDCAGLRISWSEEPRYAFHLVDKPFIRFDRPKTGERRKCTLWPETVKALKDVIGDRTEGFVFLTRKGFPLIHETKHMAPDGHIHKVTHCDPTPKKFRDLCIRAGLRPRKGSDSKAVIEEGLGFSSLRTTFETVAFNNPDMSIAEAAAIAWIMGHKLSGMNIAKMADRYFQEIDLHGLQLVTDHVRNWLLTGQSAGNGVKTTNQIGQNA